MTPRDDLGGQSPRDVLQEKRDHLCWDLEDRSRQWSMLGACPPPLDEESAAYRFGGFGTHENIVYYDLVRHLVWECWRRVVEPAADAAAPAGSQAEVLAWLGQAQEQWLNDPNWEDFSGRTPADVVGCERRRIPLAMSAEEAMIDDDCPLCQMLAEGMGPAFWWLDGCNMDTDFPFSIFHRTREEWEEERRRQEEFDRKFNEEYACKQAVLEAGLPGSEEGDPAVWTRSYSNPDAGQQSPWLRLFGIGCHVAELAGDLKDAPGGAAAAESLGRFFGNLRAALQDPSAALVGPVVDRFCEELDAAAAARPDVAAKCAELARELREFAAAAAEDNELPF